MTMCELISHIGISFGGLLMSLEGKKVHINKIENDEKVFCLLRHSDA